MASAKNTLVIVESPSKAKTIGKFLGKNYTVVASVGHIRDLPKSKLGIDIENDFEPQYISIRGKGDLIKTLKKETKNAKKVYLATDPDREGEAIAWHLAYLLGIPETEECRIVFNEITKNAVKDALKNPRAINTNLVDAQQARRVLDRLVGYQISPLLWRKVRRGLSAGRVQSAALKIICDREKIILDFKPEEYWNIMATLVKDKVKFVAKLEKYNGKKIKIENETQNNSILEDLKSGKYIVKKVEQKERIRKAPPPFTTSSLQQDASNKLNFTTKKTMMVAQQLYEGVDITGFGTIGLVTYIRTDSVRTSLEAKAAAREYIKEHIGDKYNADNVYSNKKKDVQDAHEAIRPSRIDLTPERIANSLSKDQLKLYTLIWNRFMASRMAAAVFDSVSAEIENSSYSFKATGQKIKFDGFLRLYQYGETTEENATLPELFIEEELKASKVEGKQNFTQPPARFTEATLVKELEDKNIGRPSTYAPIVATLTERKYVSREKKSLVPTELGFIVNDLMEEYFKEIVDAGFTADMEDKLDDVEIKNLHWKNIVRNFYTGFSEELKFADSKIEKVQIADVLTDEVCEFCGKPMAIKMGRFGEFMACTGYPECKNAKPIVEKTGVACPRCGKDIVKRKSRKGRVFYGCEGYPDCPQVYWNKPTEKKCPECGELLVEKKLKNSTLACSNSECGYKE